MIDSHCHLDHEPLLGDLSNVIKRSKEVGIKKLLTISTSYESFDRIKNIIQKDEMIYGTIGIHPHETTKNKITSDIIVKNITENEKIIGIGETGLDFYYNNSDKNDQINSFKEHIEASIKTNSPLIIHSRDAEVETFEILSEYKNQNLKILMHCFTGSKDFAKKLLTLNAFFSASGIITFKNSLELLKTAFENGFSMGELLTIFFPEDSSEKLEIPIGFVGIGSVCSITLNFFILPRFLVFVLLLV